MWACTLWVCELRSANLRIVSLAKLPWKLEAAIQLACELRAVTWSICELQDKVQIAISTSYCVLTWLAFLMAMAAHIWHICVAYAQLYRFNSKTLKHIVWKVAVLKIDIKLISSIRNTNLVKLPLGALIQNYY